MRCEYLTSCEECDSQVSHFSPPRPARLTREDVTGKKSQLSTVGRGWPMATGHTETLIAHKCWWWLVVTGPGK